MAGGRIHGLALFLGHSYGSKISDQYWHDEHRDKDHQHCRVWISKVRVQTQRRERDDGEIKHVSNDGKGPAGKESVARSERRGAPCHWIHAEGNHDERKGTCAGPADMCYAASGDSLQSRAETSEKRDVPHQRGEKPKDRFKGKSQSYV